MLVIGGQIDIEFVLYKIMSLYDINFQNTTINHLTKDSCVCIMVCMYDIRFTVTDVIRC